MDKYKIIVYMLFPSYLNYFSDKGNKFVVLTESLWKIYATKEQESRSNLNPHPT